MNIQERAHLAAMSSLPGVGPARLRLLVDVGEPVDVWERIRRGTLLSDCVVAAGLGAKGRALIDRWQLAAREIEPACLLERHGEAGITMLVRGDPGYPRAFADDIEPPLVLWALGDPLAIREVCVAIVGTRRCTRYGHDVARSLGRELAAAGVTVVSGLALGIDAAAHAGVLAADRACAPPVAVVGTGLDVVYPTRNRSLWNGVAERGVLFSESAPGARAEAWRFPARNRLIAALADLVIVVESAERGGSLYTVDEAVARDIEVRAVPGPITSPASSGTNRLLADGAAPVLSAAEVLETFGLEAAVASCAFQGASSRVEAPDEAALVDVLRLGAATLSDLAEASGLPFDRLVIAATSLEGRGVVSRSGGWYELAG